MNDTPREDNKPFLEKQEEVNDESSNKEKIINDEVERDMINEISSENLIDTDPEDFSVPFHRMPCKRLFSLSMLFLRQSFSLALQSTIPMLISLMNFFYLRKFQDPIYQSALTISDYYLYSMFMPCYFGLYELTAIQCSKHYGARNYAKCTATLVQTLSLFMMMFIPMIFLT